MRCLEPWPISSRSILLLLWLVTALFGGSEIRLKKQAPYHSTMSLGSIAQIRSDNPNVQRFLSQITVPSDYTSDYEVDAKEVKALLGQNLVDTSKIKILGHTQLYGAKPLSKEDLERALRSYVSSHYKDVEIQQISIFQKVPRLQRAHIRIRKRSESFSHLYLDVSLFEGKDLVKKIPVTLKILRYHRAFLAARDIPKGKVITPEDLSTKRVRLYNSLQKALRLDDVVGSVAKRTIRAGQRIKPYMIEPDYAVKRRSSVKILYRKNGIKIELLGIALENGKRGDIIRVKNISTNKVLRCKVLSSGSVLFVQ